TDRSSGGDSLIPSDRLGPELPNSALVGGDAVAPTAEADRDFAPAPGSVPERCRAQAAAHAFDDREDTS
ncbi:MAG: hypothetical protein ACXWJ7_16735, partial [Caldimonas sp.]